MLAGTIPFLSFVAEHFVAKDVKRGWRDVTRLILAGWLGPAEPDQAGSPPSPPVNMRSQPVPPATPPRCWLPAEQPSRRRPCGTGEVALAQAVAQIGQHLQLFGHLHALGDDALQSQRPG